MSAVASFADQVATVAFEPSGRSERVVKGTTLMDAVHQARLPLGQSCDGVALCGFCRVTVLEGADNLSPLGGEEKKVLAGFHAEPSERLACCARVEGPVRVTTTYW